MQISEENTADKLRKTLNTTQSFLYVHEKKRPHGCDLCRLRFAQKSQLVTHIKGKHKSVEQICGQN